MNPQKEKGNRRWKNILEFFNGEGVQHVALATNNIVDTVSELMRPWRGIFKSTHQLL